jgi:TRAP-type mannitol/chloroaromatic compound transport system permease small subunit
MKIAISKSRNVASILFVVAVLLSSNQAAHAKIINAASCQFTDVSNAVAVA